MLYPQLDGSRMLGRLVAIYILIGCCHYKPIGPNWQQRPQRD